MSYKCHIEKGLTAHTELLFDSYAKKFFRNFQKPIDKYTQWVYNISTVKVNHTKERKGFKIMKKNNFIIKKTEGGYGIFLRSMQERPLKVLPTKEDAKRRHKQYLEKLKENGYTL